jgi:tetratricopeptide (TPR) repeat protein
MSPNSTCRPFRAAALLAVALLVPARAGDIPPEVAALWKDPAFQKAFVAGYGVNAEIEPRVTASEIKILEKVRPLMAEDLPAAEEALKDEIEDDGSAMLDYTLGGIQFQQDKLDEARANFEKAVSKFPSFRRAWRNLGLLHVRAARFDEAIRSFTKMIELGGGDGYAYGLLGFAYASKEDYQPAEVAYRTALLLQPDATEWRLGLTRCVFKEKKYEDAATLLAALLDRFPDNGDFWLLQAQAFISMKQPEKAVQDLEALDALGKSTTDSLFTLGDLYVTLDLPALAAGAYGRAVDVDGQQPLERALRAAELLASRGATAEERTLIDHIHHSRDGSMQTAERTRLLKLDARLAMAEGGDGAEGVAALEEIIKLDPLDGEALLLLGQHFEDKKEPDRAIFWYERAESLAEFEVKAKVRHAQVLVSLARYADALPLLRRAQEVKARDDVARYLEQVERLAKSRG